MIKISRGLDLPIAGEPVQKIEAALSARTVALVGSDYHGMKPTMAVREGDQVKLGQVLFSDKKTPGVHYTAPASGVVKEINRGEKRVFQSLVIEVAKDESDAITFNSYTAEQLAGLDRQQVISNLVDSGLWTALRTRPYSKVPSPESTPIAVFVTAIDTNPLAADPQAVIAEHADDFVRGQVILSKLTDGKLYVCKAPGANVPAASQATVEEFSGMHPAGNPGTHIHFLDPVGPQRAAWYIGYQDVIAVGKLFTTGKLWVERVVAVAGPQAKSPRLLRTRLGASVAELCQNEQKSGDNRLISGSVFSGRTCRGVNSYLGRYHTLISILLEGKARDFMGWITLGGERYSLLNVLSSAFSRSRKLSLTTTTNGSERAMVPVGQFEEVMPLDILPTQLLRALVVGDIDTAIKLGCLELDEEDLALCTFACTGKYEYGPILRDNLTRIELEG
ncbi:NADH:ubiquinone reductase (Na(+)-transporting) subunit A [Pokkaliibacter plantistimulans]|uniref:Na(+)-translocating NADH-quinone reductase subunit A n=1 Tax=Proteobacteria bacterium 228 TaxID=2083153 RepID=A0A2S5KI61_9PROT|nr:Na(+)-translocating NADH-quinone reductase subunit A [Pokkaliibacter plantistimulans]PPC74199.1 NADH:ubiquinone reductase (Na(+)-transporting) subunit A [Pokkaliibacter plantistimulans]